LQVLGDGLGVAGGHRGGLEEGRADGHRLLAGALHVGLLSPLLGLPRLVGPARDENPGALLAVGGVEQSQAGRGPRPGRLRGAAALALAAARAAAGGPEAAPARLLRLEQVEHVLRVAQDVLEHLLGVAGPDPDALVLVRRGLALLVVLNVPDRRDDALEVA